MYRALTFPNKLMYASTSSTAEKTKYLFGIPIYNIPEQLLLSEFFT